MYMRVLMRLILICYLYVHQSSSDASHACTILYPYLLWLDGCISLYVFVDACALPFAVQFKLAAQ